MSLWKNKKEQQKIFSEVANDISNNESGPLGLLLQKDGQSVAQIATNYIKKVRKGGIIIDAGCGTGFFINEITNGMINTCHIVGIDLSTESVKIAKQKNETADFIVCDMDALPLRDNVCDMVILRNVLHHLSTLKPLGNVIGLLNSKGFMLIDDKIRGNPLQDIFFLAYPLVPYNFKMILRENAAHIDRYGNLPPIIYRSPKEYVNFVKQHSNELTILELNYHGFFLFLGVLSVLYHFFPRLSNIHMPLYKLYSLERRKILRWSAVSMTIVVERV
jgi:SAM-dependent methyltransferase